MISSFNSNEEYKQRRLENSKFDIEILEDKQNQMMRAYQRVQVHDALDARLKELEAAIASPDAIAAYRQKRRNFLDGTFGPLPKRMPLNAKVTKTIDRPSGFHPDPRAKTDADSGSGSRLRADRRNLGSVSPGQTRLHSAGIPGASRSA